MICSDFYMQSIFEEKVYLQNAELNILTGRLDVTWILVNCCNQSELIETCYGIEAKIYWELLNCIRQE